MSYGLRGDSGTKSSSRSSRRSIGSSHAASGGGWRPTVLGLSAGACFALSAVGFRGAILSLHNPSYAVAATFTLAAGLVLQSVLMTLYLVLRDRAVLAAIVTAFSTYLIGLCILLSLS